MSKMWIAQGSDQIRYALRIESVTHTQVSGCAIQHAVRGKFLSQYLVDWKVDALRQLSGSDRIGVGL